MKKVKLPPDSPVHADDIEAAFYEAMQSGDLTQLMACWADEEDIVCVHPGGARLLGAEAIRRSFAAMFENGTIQAAPEMIHRVEALNASVHSVLERVGVMTPKGPSFAFVVATNVYHKTPQGWRMVAHHASPGTPPDAREADARPLVLH
jgi:ketosteroid isomerase-like protein